jgi:hypothetical protein
MKTAKITLQYTLTGQASEDEIADAIMDLLSQAQMDGIKCGEFDEGLLTVGAITVIADEEAA